MYRASVYSSEVTMIFNRVEGLAQLNYERMLIIEPRLKNWAWMYKPVRVLASSTGMQNLQHQAKQYSNEVIQYRTERDHTGTAQT